MVKEKHGYFTKSLKMDLKCSSRGVSGVKFNSKTFLFSALWPKNASKGLKIEVFEKH